MKQYKMMEAKYLALNIRERWMVFVAGLVVIAAFANFVLIAPVIEKKQRLETGLLNFEDERAQLEAQTASGGLSAAEETNQQNKKTIEALKSDISHQKAQLKTLHSALVNPQQVREMLKGLMRNHEGVQLVSMKTVPPTLYSTQLNAQQADDAAAAQAMSAVPVIFKHGIEMTFAGQYFDLMHYSDALQTLSDYVTWDSAELNVKAYPESELTITVYTLSLDKTWLSI